MEAWSGEFGVPRVLTAKFSIPTGIYQDELPEAGYLDDSLLLRIGAVGDVRERWREYQSSHALARGLALWTARIARRDPDPNRDLIAVDDVTAAGKFTCRGNSFRLHQELLWGLKNRYASLVRDWEDRYRLGWVKEGQVARPVGEVADIVLPETLDESALEELLTTLFTCG